MAGTRQATDHEPARSRWLHFHRDTHAPFPIQRCGLCHSAPAAQAVWRPWHPHFALLCTSCRALVYNLAIKVAINRGRAIEHALGEIMAALALDD